ncbi:hypothetical protein GLOIN_2v1779851 [Rhizophagus irregularis DAOM 181602=DAOM 197198]|nr:hypothetical protein GLOIN_2v1779851 [Rhizophagus irregularis DAOM 181602=DAOM 197198]
MHYAFGFRVGFRSTETPKIRLAIRVTSEEWKNQVSFSVSGRLPSSEERKKPRFVSSGGLSKNENPKIKIRSGGLPKNENPKVKISSGGLPKNENPKIKIHKCGGLPKNENPKIKIHSGGLLKNENPKVKIRKFGWASEERKPKGSGGLPKNGKRRTFKIRSGGFSSFQGIEKTKDSFSGLLKNNGKPRFVLGSLEKVEPRFVWCLEWIPINRKNQRFFWWVSKRSRFVSIYEYMNNVIVEL